MNIYKPQTPLTNREGRGIYPLTTADQVIFNDNKRLNDLFNLIYPVGSIYISISEVNPTTLFGGEWEQIKGRFLVGVGPLDDNTTDYWGALTEKYNMPAGEKGGQTLHQLAIDEIPAHKHWISAAAYDDGNGSSTGQNNSQDYGLWADAGKYSRDDPRKNYGRYTAWAGGNGSGQYRGSGTTAHNNIPPYYAVYMWQRIR